MLGANDRVRLGFIGVANRGMQLIAAFLENPDAEVAALCDIRQSTLEKAGQQVGGKAVLLDDFRKLFDRTDIDAVVIATPDHWHALQTIAACRAGKDVYVEKPLSHNHPRGPADGRSRPADQARGAGGPAPPLVAALCRRGQVHSGENWAR